MSTDVKITPFHVLSEDARGQTADFSLPSARENFIYLERKAGSLSGNTYHEGKSPATNPKVFLLLTGKILFSYRKVGEQKKHSEEVIAPAMIEISPYVTHNVKTLEDSILLECNGVADIQEDRIREEV